MKNHLKLVLLAALASGAAAALAGGMQKHKALAVEDMPPVCQEYFKRAQACYAKAGSKASFQRGNTVFLQQSLAAANEKQQIKMCEIALHEFPEKTKNLNCE